MYRLEHPPGRPAPRRAVIADPVHAVASHRRRRRTGERPTINSRRLPTHAKEVH
jgi:hypothetical protein